MRTFLWFLLFGIFARTAFGQAGGVKEISKTEFEKGEKQAKEMKTKKSKVPASGSDTTATTSNTSGETPITNKVNKGVDFGVSLGFNSVFEKMYGARVSPLDNKLKVENAPTAAFMLSTGVSVPLNMWGGGRYYRQLDSEGNETETVNYVPYGLCAMATVNLVTFNSAASGSAFNQKLDGGLGLAYRFNDDFQISLTGEMISYRVPRDFLVNDYKEKVLTNAAGNVITALNLDDNDYFTDRYMPSISLKFFYLISYKPVK